MSARHEEIQPEHVPLKSDADPEKLKVDANSAKDESSGDDKKERKKICRIWQRKSPRSYNFGCEKDDAKKSRMANAINLENRDDKNLNNHITMDFGEVFAEPNGSHSFNWTWLATNRVFTATSSIIYKLIAAFIAIPFAVFFGILFAIFAVISVFLCTPLGVLLGIPLNALSKSWDFIICRFLNPITKSICWQRKKDEKNAIILNA
uniref:Caveolin n=1 Tax=Elaeophora elaphi TaxID=1147741 RepID=A0A0R3S0T8_9BILA